MSVSSGSTAEMNLFDTIDKTSWLTHDPDGNPWRSSSELSDPERLLPPIPADETLRLETLRALEIDDSAHSALDELTRLCAELCGSEFAAISLVDRTVTRCKSGIGLDSSEFPRSASFCAWAILPGRNGVAPNKPVVVIPNTLLDRRFARNPLVVGEPFIRSYMGAPLIAQNNQKIGVICAFSASALDFTPARIEGIQRLAQLVMREFESQVAKRSPVSSVSLREQLKLQQLSHEMRSPLHSIVGHAQLLLDSALSQDQLLLTGNILKSAETLTQVVRSMIETRLAAADFASNALRDALDWAELRKDNFELAPPASNSPHMLGASADGPHGSLDDSAIFNCSDGLEDDLDRPGAHEAEWTDFSQIRSSWAKISISAQEVSASIHDTLFELDPRLRCHFSLELQDHELKLMQTISLVVRNLSCWQRVEQHLLELGCSHSRLGISSEMLSTLSTAVLRTFAAFFGSDWTAALYQAWECVLSRLCASMQAFRRDTCDGPASNLRSSPPATEHPSRSSVGSSVDFRSFKVLNVDDNALNRTLLNLFIRRLGVIDIVDAEDGQDCLNQLDHFTCDCVFLDLQMPVMGGTVAAVHIRERLGKRRPFLVAITADVTPGMPERCKEAGFDAILNKPCSIRTVRQALEQAAAWRSCSGPP